MPGCASVESDFNAAGTNFCWVFASFGAFGIEAAFCCSGWCSSTAAAGNAQTSPATIAIERVFLIAILQICDAVPQPCRSRGFSAIRLMQKMSDGDAAFHQGE
jgi:hypothetical protein